MPYGKIILAAGDEAQSNPFRFSTEYQDVETELVYYGMRYYSADLGRWLSRDPLEEYGGVNLYAFALNNSVNLKDSYGLACSLQSALVDAVKGAATSFMRTYLLQRGVTAAAKIVASQVAPVVGQVAGFLMTGWEVVSFGRTAYKVYTNSGRIRDALRDFYDDPRVAEWIACLSEEECGSLATQMGNVIGSFIANRKEAEQGIRKVKELVKRYIAIGKAKYKNSLLASEIGAISDTTAVTSGGKWNWGYGEIGDDAAEAAYEAIRESSTDVAAIARYTGYKAGRLQEIKDYLFNNKEWNMADPDTAAAWHRLRTGRGTENDRLLLKHETAELWYRKNVEDDYPKGHQKANTHWNWEQTTH